MRCYSFSLDCNQVLLVSFSAALQLKTFAQRIHNNAPRAFHNLNEMRLITPYTIRLITYIVRLITYIVRLITEQVPILLLRNIGTCYHSSSRNSPMRRSASSMCSVE